MPQRKVKERISERDAVKVALGYFEDIYPSTYDGLALEEIELSNDGSYWLVTLGIWKPKPKSLLDKEIEQLSGIVLQLPSAEMLRVYKVVKVDAANGTPVSMKMRDE